VTNFSYDVQIWGIKPRKNRQGKITSYRLRWKVGKREFYESFKVRALADSFRADLLSAQRDGERFDTVTGLPVEHAKDMPTMSWFEVTSLYVAMKWPDLAATARQTTVEALIRIMPVFVPEQAGTPEPKEIRSVLRQWGYNPPRLASGEAPISARRVLEWLMRYTDPVGSVAEPEVLRSLQRAVTRRLDGGAFAPSVARRTRSVLSNVLDYARTELKVLENNPLPDVKWTKMPKGKRKIDKRAVPNPVQARTLLQQIGRTPRSGPHLRACLVWILTRRPG